jgi:hypothetical protein
MQVRILPMVARGGKGWDTTLGEGVLGCSCVVKGTALAVPLTKDGSSFARMPTHAMKPHEWGTQVLRLNSFEEAEKPVASQAKADPSASLGMTNFMAEDHKFMAEMTN